MSVELKPSADAWGGCGCFMIIMGIAIACLMMRWADAGFPGLPK